MLVHRKVGQPLDNQRELNIWKMMGSEFGIFFDSPSECVESILTGQCLSEQKEMTREEQLAVCDHGITSNEPLCLTTVFRMCESLANPDWPRDFKQKYRYSLILYIFCITCLKLTAFEKLNWHKNWEVESETRNFMVQINEFGHFFRQMVYIVHSLLG